MAIVSHHIKDASLADEGFRRIEWASREMAVLRGISARFSREKPLRAQRITACLHVTTETANLLLALKEGGAEVAVCASNPLSTQDDVAAALIESGVSAFCIRGEDHHMYYRHIHQALDIEPTLTMDDGADMVTVIHNERKGLIPQILGGTEETTTGVIRLRAMAQEGILAYPIIAVNDAKTKHLFDNRYGTGQSTIDGILRATNILLAGKRVVVAGYGWCGKGIAMRARGMGARVIVAEVDSIQALEAVMDGYEVMPMDDAVSVGDIFITATGCKDVISERHFEKMKDGAILCNAGHFNVELNIAALARMGRKRRIRQNVDEYAFQSGKKLYVLGEGRLINLAAAEGHPASVMDMSFANQALCVEYLAQHSNELTRSVHPVPEEIDKHIALMKLESMSIRIDTLSEEQKQYLSGWQEGT